MKLGHYAPLVSKVLIISIVTDLFQVFSAALSYSNLTVTVHFPQQVPI